MDESLPQNTQNVPDQNVNNGLGKGTKIAIGAFVTLLIIVVAELAYLYINPNSQFDYKVLVSSILPKKTNKNLVPIPQLTTYEFLPKEEANSDAARKTADLIDYYGKSTFLINAETNLVYKGVVKSTSTAEPLPTSYQIELEEEGNPTHTTKLRMTKDEIDGGQIYLVNNGTINQIRFGEIRIGDTITLKSSLNLLSNSSDAKIVIQVERQ